MESEDVVDTRLKEVCEEMVDVAVSQGREVRVECRGECMSPLLRDGDQVLFRRCNPDRLKYPDIIIFRNKEGRGTSTHRYIRCVKH